MNNIFKSILLGITCLSISSCSKDLGNYQYSDINEISISGIEEEYSAIFKADTLRLTPDLSFTKDNESPNRYSYEWKLVQNPTTTVAQWKGTIIGRERNLNYLVSALPGQYSIYYKVTDRQTDVTWSTRTVLNITTETSQGYLLAGQDQDGYAALEMISFAKEDTLILRELLKDNGLPKFKGASAAFHTGGGSSAVGRAAKIWVAGEQQGYYLNTTTFASTANNTLGSIMYTSYQMPSNLYPIDYLPKPSLSGSIVGANRVLLTNSGDLFFANLNSGDIYANPVNRLSTVNGTPIIKLAPHLFAGGGANALAGYMVYDMENNRFLRTTLATSTNLTVLADAQGDPFPWNQPAGRTLLYGENTKNTDAGGTNGNSFAIMKDEDGKLYLYKFYAHGVPSKKNAYIIQNAFANELLKSNFFAFSSTRTALYFAIDTKLYAYDYSLGNEKIVMVHDFGEEITMLHADMQASSNSLDLYVATYSTDKIGSLHKMILQNNTNSIELRKDESVRWTGLSKINKMSWRNTTQ